ncbi:alpha/beta fold hydrolase BchO [Methylobacterium brachythecii]|uniref:Alpha/beta hydrolase n=1 Tax=Methylobacterium brachythecii TaxID=1176177 RepID=A0A7W6APF8_9HYPH|nr:alpha/beta fold hydrolase BchO [Methylobacterium brachythecii]MBB3905039.1 magnesium chelatase accessory protein [Methylobacterium brachythecii]GLS46309.1 alpha/beta hydrolase [Methylobacterium brachythecii]
MASFFQEDRLDWERDGADWPNREASRFVEADGLRWHVQEFGDPASPVLLLLHGTGAATHSWRAFAPLLARDFRIVAPDLPGHGFSDPLPARDLSLPGMARAVAELLRVLGISPEIAAGHSAGAAILCRMCLDGAIDPRLLIAFNGALKPFPGAASFLFPTMARMLFLNPVTPKVFAWTADRSAVKRLIDGTGSRLDPQGLDLYKRLLAKSGHIAGALGMMANWDLDSLDRDLPKLRQPMVLVVGSEDRAILPETSFAVQDRLADSRVELMRGLGHLAHEEAPERVAELVLREARRAGVTAEVAAGA